jgi:hypothetical protein
MSTRFPVAFHYQEVIDEHRTISSPALVSYHQQYRLVMLYLVISKMIYQYSYVHLIAYLTSYHPGRRTLLTESSSYGVR